MRTKTIATLFALTGTLLGCSPTSQVEKPAKTTTLVIDDAHNQLAQADGSTAEVYRIPAGTEELIIDLKEYQFRAPKGLEGKEPNTVELSITGGRFPGGGLDQRRLDPVKRQCRFSPLPSSDDSSLGLTAGQSAFITIVLLEPTDQTNTSSIAFFWSGQAEVVSDSKETSMPEQSVWVTELTIIGVLLVVVVAFYIVPFWRICSKMGYSGALSLLMFVPLVNLILYLFLAFSKWPIERRLEQIQSDVNSPARFEQIRAGPTPPPVISKKGQLLHKMCLAAGIVAILGCFAFFLLTFMFEIADDKEGHAAFWEARRIVRDAGQNETVSIPRKTLDALSHYIVWHKTWIVAGLNALIGVAAMLAACSGDALKRGGKDYAVKGSPQSAGK